MSAEIAEQANTTTGTRYAVRGAAGFGLTALIVFALSAWYATATGQSHPVYFLAAGPLCGIIGGLAYGRRIGLPLVLATCFAFVGALFILQDARSSLLIDVVITGLVSAFLFWVIGGCAILGLPVKLKFDGARAFALPGGLAGMVFQFFYGPARTLFDLGSRPWWDTLAWEHLFLWLIAGVGGGWLFGAELDRLHRRAESPARAGKKNNWAVASLVFGVAGLAIGGAYFLRFGLPLGLPEGLSPASAAADWLLSWSLLAAVAGSIALIRTFRNPKQSGRSWAIAGVLFAAALFFTSVRIVANPWKTQFNSNYAARLLREHGNPADREYGYARYTGNLILAQDALDSGDLEKSGRHLLEAATTSGWRNIEKNGPDTAVARVLLQRGQREAVLEYLHRCRNLWPQGERVLDRWEATIRAGRQPNFNNRSPSPPEGSSVSSRS